MTGPSSNERETLGSRTGWLELGLVLAGVTVVAGLAIEYAPEFTEAFKTRHLPRIGTLGGVLVTMGVAAELILGIFITKTSQRLQHLSDVLIADANARIAEAGTEAAKANARTEELRRRGDPRRVGKDFADLLKNRPAATVSIWYMPEDVEAMSFAVSIGMFLSLTEWQGAGRFPEPIPANAVNGDLTKGPSDGFDAWKTKTPLLLRVGGAPGISLVARNLDDNPNTSPLGALSNALLRSSGNPFGVQLSLDSTLPDGFIRLIVGPKP